jgi:oligoribonuclease NrnB/cAMP/cGMP phosphodiesterase (DHH superfamily)
MLHLAEEAAALTWIDHHSSHASFAKNHQIPGLFDLDDCGAGLAWRYFFGTQREPWWLPVIRAKDLWRWENDEQRALACGLQYLITDATAPALWDLTEESVLKTGSILWHNQQKNHRKALAQARLYDDPFGLKGRRAAVLYFLQQINEIAELAAKPPAEGGLACDITIGLSQRSDGLWIHSLRSSVINCAALAQARGGGGHPNAASYLATHPFPESDDSEAHHRPV